MLFFLTQQIIKNFNFLWKLGEWRLFLRNYEKEESLFVVTNGSRV